MQKLHTDLEQLPLEVRAHRFGMAATCLMQLKKPKAAYVAQLIGAAFRHFDITPANARSEPRFEDDAYFLQIELMLGKLPHPEQISSREDVRKIRAKTARWLVDNYSDCHFEPLERKRITQHGPHRGAQVVFAMDIAKDLSKRPGSKRSNTQELAS